MCPEQLRQKKPPQLLTSLSVAKSSESSLNSAVNRHSVALIVPDRYHRSCRACTQKFPGLWLKFQTTCRIDLGHACKFVPVLPNLLIQYAHAPWLPSLLELKYAHAVSCHPLCVPILPTYTCLIKASLLADLENFGCEFTLCVVTCLIDRPSTGRPPRTETYSGVGGELTRARISQNRRAPLHWLVSLTKSPHPATITASAC
jgi:hypothetical protein